MSSSAATTHNPRPHLKTRTTSTARAWGWPRLVDIPVEATSRRSSSVRSHTGAFQPSNHSPIGSGRSNRASSLTDECTSAAPLSGEVPVPKPTSEGTSTAVVAKAASEVPEAPEAAAEEAVIPQTAALVPGSAPERIPEEEETCHDPKHPSVEPRPLCDSTGSGTETSTGSRHQLDPDTMSSPSRGSMKVLQAIGLLPSSSGKQAEEPSKEPAEKTAGIASETSAQPDLTTLPPLPASPIPEPAHDSNLEKPASTTPLPYPTSSETPTASTEMKNTINSQDTPRPFPVFRELPAEPAEPTEPVAANISAPPLEDHQQRPVSTSGVPAPLDADKLPPPRIFVIRASSDNQADMMRSPVTPDAPDDIGNPLENVNTTSPNSPVPSDVHPGSSLSSINPPTAPDPPNTPTQGANMPSGPGVPDEPLSISDPTSEKLGAVNAAELPSPRRQRRGKKLIRKTRRVVMRSPVLKIVLGRQLAHLTQPALKIIAEGGELPPMALGSSVGDTVRAVTAPVGMVGVMRATAEAMA